MLARLLRIVFISQCATVAAWAIWAYGVAHWHWAVVLALVLTLPLIFNAFLVGLCALQGRSPDESAAQWWKSVWGETWATLRVFSLRQPWAGAPPDVEVPAGGGSRVPVLLVHGFICNHRLWDDMRPHLLAKGHAVLAIDLEPVFTSIDHYAPRIEAAVQRLRLQTGAEQVALVGHSMGGVAIRAWLRKYGSAHAAGVLTLGTPHVGTKIGGGMPTPAAFENARQMQWHSDWLNALAASETDATRALFQIALTAQDDIVFPQRAQVLPGVPVTVFEGIGHLQMVLHPPVIAWTLQCLENLPLRGTSA